MNDNLTVVWSDISTVLLDMDGTLLDLHFDNYFWFEHLPKRLAELRKQPIAETKLQLDQHIRSIEGTLNWYCLDYWSDALGVDVAALKREIRAKVAIRPYVVEFLTGLQRLNKQVILATNSHQAGLDLKLQQSCLGEYFDAIVSSHRYQAPKEEPEFWQRFIEEHPFEPETTLFIDDNAKVLAAAQAFGIGYLLGIHQPDSQLPRRVKTFPAIEHFDEIMPGKPFTK